jgi:hypothetical protein
MNFINCLLDATDAVLTWEISEEGLADAIKNQACLMAGIDPDELSCFDSD